MWPKLIQKLTLKLRVATSFIYCPKVLIPIDVGHSNRPPRNVGEKQSDGKRFKPNISEIQQDIPLVYGPHKWETIFIRICLLGQFGSDTILGMSSNLTQKLLLELKIVTSFIYCSKFFIPTDVGHFNTV